MSLSDPKITRLINFVAPQFKSFQRSIPPDLQKAVISFILCSRDTRYCVGLPSGYPWTTLVMIIVAKFRRAAPFLVVPKAQLHEWAEYAAWHFVLFEARCDKFSSLFPRQEFGIILGNGGKEDHLNERKRASSWKPEGPPEEWLEEFLRSIMETSQTSSSSWAASQTCPNPINSNTVMSQTTTPPSPTEATPSSSTQAIVKHHTVQENHIQTMEESSISCPSPKANSNIGTTQDIDTKATPESSQGTPEAIDLTFLDIDSLTFEVAQAEAVSDESLGDHNKRNEPSTKRARSETPKTDPEEDPWRKLARIDPSAVAAIKRKLEAEIDLRDAFFRNDYEKKLLTVENEHLQAELKSLQKRIELNEERLKMNEREKEFIERLQAMGSMVPESND